MLTSLEAKNRLAGAIFNIGSTVEEVHKTIQDAGMKGERGNSCNCPLSKYFSQVLDATIQVGARSIWYSHVIDTLQLMPEHLILFRERFDTGFYPELEEKVA